MNELEVLDKKDVEEFIYNLLVKEKIPNTPKGRKYLADKIEERFGPLVLKDTFKINKVDVDEDFRKLDITFEVPVSWLNS